MFALRLLSACLPRLLKSFCLWWCLVMSVVVVVVMLVMVAVF
jgi:hypothetical protein